jgi:plasmid stabilization system protein ParE
MRPQARVDLLEIWHYIAPHNMSAATRMVDNLEAAIRGLAEMPGKGHARRDVTDPRYRFWAVRPYVIDYHYDDGSLTVVRVVHGARNFRRLFRP